MFWIFLQNPGLLYDQAPRGFKEGEESVLFSPQ